MVEDGEMKKRRTLWRNKTDGAILLLEVSCGVHSSPIWCDWSWWCEHSVESNVVSRMLVGTHETWPKIWLPVNEPAFTSPQLLTPFNSILSLWNRWNPVGSESDILCAQLNDVRLFVFGAEMFSIVSCIYRFMLNVGLYLNELHWISSI